MIAETFTVLCGGQTFGAFTTMRVTAGYHHAVRQAHFTVAAPGGGAAAKALFKTHAPVVVRMGADVLLTGYVMDREPTFAARGPHHVSVFCDSKGVDAVECTPVHPTGRFVNMNMLQIVQQLDAFGIGFASDLPLPALAEHHIQLGEPLFRVAERLARQHGATLTGQPDGSIKITNASAGAPRHAGGLIEGQNIERGSARESGRHRHSKVHARGQSYHGHGDAALALESVATDAQVPRNRTLVLPVDGDMTKDRLSKRARHHRNRAAGNALRAQIETVYCRDVAGAPWTPGRTVWLESPFLAIAQNMLIEQVTFAQDARGGTRAHLGLVDPRAYQGAPSGVNRSGDGWAMDASDAS